MEIHLFLSGLAEDYLVAIFQKISELKDDELTNDEKINLIIDILEKGVEAKWGEISGFNERDLDYLGGSEENIWYTFFGDAIELRQA